MTEFKYSKVWYFVADRAIYILQHDRTYCIFLESARSVQISIIRGLVYTDMMKFLN